MPANTLWYTRCPLPTAFGLAVQLGWIDEEFAAEGIAIRSLASSADPTVREAHFHYTQPNLFRQGGPIPPLVSRSGGADVRLVGLSWSGASHPILARPESGIATAADLQGRRLALPHHPNDSIDIWRAGALWTYTRALATVDLELDDVELVDVLDVRDYFREGATTSTAQDAALWGAESNISNQRAEALALVRGEVDAIASFSATAAILEPALGLSKLRYPQPASRLPVLFTVSGRLLSEQPELAARALARALDAAAWAQGDERKAKRIVAFEGGIPEELADRAYGSDVHRQLAIDLDAERLAALYAIHDHLLEHGFLHGPVDLEAFIAPEPLTRAAALHDARHAAVP